MQNGGLQNERYLDWQDHFHLSQGLVGTLGIKAHSKCLRLTVGQVLHSVQLCVETWLKKATVSFLANSGLQGGISHWFVCFQLH